MKFVVIEVRQRPQAREVRQVRELIVPNPSTLSSEPSTTNPDAVTLKTKRLTS